MEDFEWGLLVLGGIALVSGIAVAALFLTQQAPSTPTTVTNEETWEWTDRHGQRRTLTAHRKATSKREVVKF